MHVILHVIVCNAVCNESCNAVCNESYYIAYYMPLHEILHACYMTLKIWEVLHVMACNWHVITCHYMHYMPLHAIEDANGTFFTTTLHFQSGPISLATPASLSSALNPYLLSSILPVISLLNWQTTQARLATCKSTQPLVYSCATSVLAIGWRFVVLVNCLPGGWWRTSGAGPAAPPSLAMTFPVHQHGSH